MRAAHSLCPDFCAFHAPYPSLIPCALIRYSAFPPLAKGESSMLVIGDIPDVTVWQQAVSELGWQVASGGHLLGLVMI